MNLLENEGQKVLL